MFFWATDAEKKERNQEGKKLPNWDEKIPRTVDVFKTFMQQRQYDLSEKVLKLMSRLGQINLA